MPRPISRAELARLKGVSGAAITKACKKQLLEACLDNGRIDLDHPAVRKYLGDQGEAPPSAPAPTPEPTQPPSRTKRERTPPASPPRSPEPAASRDSSLDEDGRPIEELTLREVAERFGTMTAFKDHLDALKKLVDIREKDLKNNETEGRLIERELVKTHVFGAIEAGNRRLLTDSPKTIARRLFALAKSGGTLEEAERTVREILGSTLDPVKASASRVLRNA